MAANALQLSPWAVARAQHDVISHEQLDELGFTRAAIRHRLDAGRLFEIRHQVYAVGRPSVTREGQWMAAVLACGQGAVLSHDSAAALWRIRRCEPTAPIHVSIPLARCISGSGIVPHRRKALNAADVTTRNSIPTTTIECTLIDMALRLSDSHVDAMLNEADKLDLIDWDALSEHLAGARARRHRGAARLLYIINERLIVLTDSELERMFVRISKKAGIPPPESGVWLNGFKTDFYWRQHELVVECDSLRHHRTAAQQTRDRERDQAHLLAGLTPLRFTHAQIARRTDYVAQTVKGVATRNTSGRGGV